MIQFAKVHNLHLNVEFAPWRGERPTLNPNA
jgi:hypothetical protein